MMCVWPCYIRCLLVHTCTIVTQSTVTLLESRTTRLMQMADRQRKPPHVQQCSNAMLIMFDLCTHAGFQSDQVTQDDIIMIPHNMVVLCI